MVFLPTGGAPQAPFAFRSQKPLFSAVRTDTSGRVGFGGMKMGGPQPLAGASSINRRWHNRKSPCHG